jgi:hypothetical protein
LTFGFLGTLGLVSRVKVVGGRQHYCCQVSLEPYPPSRFGGWVRDPPEGGSLRFSGSTRREACGFLCRRSGSRAVEQIPGVLVAALVLGVVTAGTKMFGGWWVARCPGIGSAGRLRVRAGLALILRGEFSIIIAGLAGGVAGAEVPTPSPPPTCWSWPSAAPWPRGPPTPNRRGAPAAA